MGGEILGQGRARIRVMGGGGGGGNAVNRMMRAGIEGVEFVAVNTDAQVLTTIQAHRKLQIGVKLTGGLGAGGDPEVGRMAAEESKEEIADILQGLDMVFITAGMGGGTGTGASPVIAEIAKNMGILTVAIVTKPFLFEGTPRMKRAEEGISRLSQHVDALITVANERLLRIAPPDMPITRAFELADEVLKQGVQGITEVITVPGLINLDFADVESVLRDAGTALMGIGEAEGENRSREAARKAVTSPLLDCSMRGAKKAIVNVMGGEDLALDEVREATEVVREALADKADIFVGAVIKDGLQRVRVTVVATGFSSEAEGEEEKLLSEEEGVLRKLERSYPRNNNYDVPAFLRSAKREGKL
ncbi:cell division protein FtsZ [Candidatus Bipolaricaulota bacterium]|nr:cell division protein FtsZ [Candidatus Bipolaricaulota bacterium]